MLASLVYCIKSQLAQLQYTIINPSVRDYSVMELLHPKILRSRSGHICITTTLYPVHECMLYQNVIDQSVGLIHMKYTDQACTSLLILLLRP